MPGRRHRVSKFGQVISTRLPDATYQLVATAPTSGTLVSTAAATAAKSRRVFGSVILAATASNLAQITISIETGTATGVYSAAQILSIPAGISGSFKLPFCFEVAAGRRYKFVKGAASSVTETIDKYSYIEW